MSDREVLSWSGFGQATRELARMVARNGFVPDLILGVARGGLLPAGALGYALECKNLFTLNVEFYTGVDTRLEMPVMLPPILNATELDDLDVLIVDDVADTGKTLELVQEYCADHVAEAKTAVLYHKPQSIIVPDYSWRRTSLWIDFPWSVDPPVTTETATMAPTEQES